MLHGILRDVLVQDSDLVNAAHDAPHLGDRRPCQTARLVEGFQPPLNVERLDVFRDFVTEARNEVGAHDLLDVTDGIHRFRAHSIRAEIGFKVMLRQEVK
jgi:hypothetical protein